MDKNKAYRAVDANANRAVEGLRTAEDGVRFALDNKELTARFRELRHTVRATAAALPGGAQKLLAARDSAGDVARNAPSAARADVEQLVLSNLKRAQEAVRAMEEFSRVLDPAASATFGEARFKLYDIEKDTAAALAAARRPQLPQAPFLYAVADYATLCSGGDFKFLDLMVSGGCRVVQLREKNGTDRELVAMAERTRKALEGKDALLFVNDRVDIALASGAHGVHLGQDDLSPEAARHMAGENLLMGVSTHSMKQAKIAALHGPDYISLGAIFASPTKPERKPVGITLLKSVCRAFDVPVVAIGGITADNAGQVAASGAAGAAVITALSRAKNPASATKKILSALEKDYHPPQNKEDAP